MTIFLLIHLIELMFVRRMDLRYYFFP